MPAELTTEYIVMACVLRVSGIPEAIQDWLSSSGLAERVYPRARPSRSGKAFVNLEVSDADFDDIGGQIRDAVAFLKQFGSTVEQLAHTSGIDRVVLDFGTAMPADRAWHSVVLPRELIHHAGRAAVDVEISSYPVEESDESDDETPSAR
jgi:hypothetical protein